MANPTESSAGIDDGIFVDRLRDFMEDAPVFSPENLIANGQDAEYRVTDWPIYDGDPYFSVNVLGITQEVVPDRASLAQANQITVDFETGWIFWWQDAPPPNTSSQPIAIRKYKVRWRDEKMMEALSAGLRMMFPKVWQKNVDTSLTLNVNQWDYTLPAIFADPRVMLYQVEVQVVPNATERFQPIQNWRRIGNTLLQLPYSQWYPPGTILRLSYAGPYQSLGDLEDQLQFLPLLYAKGYLLSNKEIVRVRLDTMNTNTNENAIPVGSSQNAGMFFINQFNDALVKMTRPKPLPPIQYTYSR